MLTTTMLTPGPQSTRQVISKLYNTGYACATVDVHDLIKEKVCYQIHFSLLI